MEKQTAKISACSSMGCGHKCCEFHEGNYIVLSPGELQKAKLKGLSIKHLEIVDADYHGGQKVVCHAEDKRTCDSGFKPNDCAWYPVYPATDEHGNVSAYVRGAKCPLQPEHLREHISKVARDVTEQVKAHPQLAQFFAKVEMVGYEPPRAFLTKNSGKNKAGKITFG